MTVEQLNALADRQGKAPAGVTATFDGDIATVTVADKGVIESARVRIPFGVPPKDVAGHLESARRMAARKVRFLTEDDDD